MKTTLIVQARMTSERLPGKVLKMVLGKTLLEYELERLRRVPKVDEVVVATTTNSTDEPIIDLCKRLKAAVFRGSEQDVLSRFYEAAKKHEADTVIRVCADCPIIDPEIVGMTLNHYLAHKERYDYVSNVLERSFPRGLDCEVFSFKALAEAFREATHPYEREHVTPFIHDQPQRYRLGGIRCDQDLSSNRWTVDTEEDFELMRRIITELYPVDPRFGMQETLDLFAKHPALRTINAHIKQKPEQPVR